PVLNASLSANAKLLATVHLGCKVRLWDPASGRLIRELKTDLKAASQCGKRDQWSKANFNQNPFDLVFTLDARLLSVHHQYGSIQTWETRTGRSVGSISSGTGWIAVSSDGKLLAIPDGQALQITEAGAGHTFQTVRKIEVGTIDSVFGGGSLAGARF